MEGLVYVLIASMLVMVLREVVEMVELHRATHHPERPSLRKRLDNVLPWPRQPRP